PLALSPLVEASVNAAVAPLRAELADVRTLLTTYPVTTSSRRRKRLGRWRGVSAPTSSPLSSPSGSAAGGSGCARHACAPPASGAAPPADHAPAALHRDAECAACSRPRRSTSRSAHCRTQRPRTGPAAPG